MKEKIVSYSTHIVCCVTFLLLPYISTYGDHMRLPDLTHSPHDRTEFIVYILMLGCFYLNYFVFVPKLYFTRKYLAYAGLAIALAVLLLYIPSYFSGPHPQTFIERPPPAPGLNGDPGKPPPPLETGRDALLYLVGMLVSLFMRTSNRLLLVEQDKMAAELSYLKAQVNPHFLFNTLNSIYAMAIAKDEQTPAAIVQLSDLMRYITRDAHNDYVPLEKEIAYISNYIALQQARLGDTIAVEYSVEGDMTGKMIAPLLLVSFIENAFKHGVNPDEDAAIHIKISVQQNDLELQVYNKKVHTVSLEEGHGIGLANTKRRLQLIYPARHNLNITETAKDYSIRLILQL